MTLLITANTFAQVPDGSTGMCKDGTYTSAASKKGACAGHKGIKDWYAAEAAPAAASTDTPAATATKKSSKKAAAAQESAPVPDGSTGMCKDGTYTSAASKKGACAGHKGIKEWYAADAAPASTPAASKQTAPSATITSPAAAPATQISSSKQDLPKTAASGGGAGKVWVNTDSNVYHCEGGRYYGKTKQGEYMTEAAAKASGARPDHGKACS
jgi:hypothetical protein